MHSFPNWYNRFAARIDHLLNRGLQSDRRLSLRLRWPLYLLPLILFSQIVTPHAVWTMLLVVLIALYGLAYFWARDQVRTVKLARSHQGTLLVAGDTLTEDFELRNGGRLPVLWAEFVDLSDLPGYQASRVVGVSGDSSFRWNGTATCERRGVYRLGPSRVNMGDPFGLFQTWIDFDRTDALLIYPRVAKLPEMMLPRGNADGVDRHRRQQQGIQPGASVRAYQRGDSLRHIHWPMTAHRGDLTVREMELEPSGDVWIALDLNRATHSFTAAQSTLETAIIAAASLTAALLEGGEQRAVGLLAVSGKAAARAGGGPDQPSQVEFQGDAPDTLQGDTLLVPPLPGRAQLWRVLSALAPVEPSDVSLAQVLHQSGPALGRRRSLVVITADDGMAGPEVANSEVADIESTPAWMAELLHLQAAGLQSSVIFVVPQDGPSEAADALRSLLAGFDIPVNMLPVDASLPPVITYRRTRTELRSTPTGGVIVREVEEEVG